MELIEDIKPKETKPTSVDTKSSSITDRYGFRYKLWTLDYSCKCLMMTERTYDKYEYFKGVTNNLNCKLQVI